jgi:hypothetical protein
VRVWIKLEKANREESEPQEFSYLPATKSYSQQCGTILALFSTSPKYFPASNLF